MAHASAVASPRIRAARTTQVRTAHAAHVAQGVIVIHLVDAWVLRAQGETNGERRLILLTAVASLAALVWTTETRLRHRGVGLARLIEGLLGVTTIGPIVVSHLDKQGLNGARTTGVLAVCGALWLLSSGATRVFRTARGWQRPLTVVLALVIAQFVVLPLSMAVLVTNAATPPLREVTPADFGLSYGEVRLATSGGITLAGWYVPSRNGSAVILRHGSGSTRVNTLEHARFLAAAGYGVLMMDARGHGDSGGRINEIGWHGVQDIAASLDHLETRKEITGGIGVLGLSMGGEEALLAAAADERLAAVIAEGVGIGNYNDSVATGEHVIARSVNWIQFSLVDLLSDADQPRGIADTIGGIAPRPALIISGQPSTEGTMGSLYAEAGGETVTHWRLADTPHTDGLRVHRAEYIQRVLGLFARALDGSDA